MGIRITESEKNEARLYMISGKVFTNLYSKWDQSCIVITYQEHMIRPTLTIFLDGEYQNTEFTGEIDDMTTEHQLIYRKSTNELFQSLMLDPTVIQLMVSEDRRTCDLDIYAMSRINLELLKNKETELHSPLGLELSIGDNNGGECSTMAFHELKYETIVPHDDV